MADVRVSESHQLSPDAAIERLKPFEEMMAKYGVKAIWQGQAAELKGTGVSGSIDVTPTDVTVLVKLGFLAKAAGVDGDRLATTIKRRLQHALHKA
jgi:putative polyhydroxyalkanoate system protein